DLIECIHVGRQRELDCRGGIFIHVDSLTLPSMPEQSRREKMASGGDLGDAECTVFPGRSARYVVDEDRRATEWTLGRRIDDMADERSIHMLQCFWSPIEDHHLPGAVGDGVQ